MRDVYEDHLAIENLEEPYHAYGMTLIRMIYNTMWFRNLERHPVTLRGNKSTKWHDDTSRNTLIAKSLAP